MAGVTIAKEPQGGGVEGSCRRAGAEILPGDAGGERWVAPAARKPERLHPERDAG